MTKQKGIKFVKVETDRPLLTFYPPKYELEPRLYMEMLENSAKVKPTLRNTEWISKNSSSLSVSMNDNKINENSYNKSPPKSPSTINKKQKIIDITNASETDLKNFDDRISERKSYDDKSDDLDNLTGSIKFGFKNRLKQKRDERRDDDERRRSRDDDDRRDDRRSRDDDDRRDERRSRDDDDRRDDRRDERRDERRDDDEKKKNESPLSKMLKGEDDTPTPRNNEKQSEQSPQQPQNPQQRAPPSLSEITEGKVQVDSNGIRSLDYITTDERDGPTLPPLSWFASSNRPQCGLR